LGKIDNFAVEAAAAHYIAIPSANGYVIEDRVDCQRPEVRGRAPCGLTWFRMAEGTPIET
jgi:hypothetical protein